MSPSPHHPPTIHGEEPESRAISRGVLGETIKPRSKAGRFLLRVVAELTAQLGHEPGFAERRLLDRVARAEWRLHVFNERLDAGEELTDREERLHLVIGNNQRLVMQALGLLRPAPSHKAEKPGKPDMNTWREVMADLAAPYEDDEKPAGV